MKCAKPQAWNSGAAIIVTSPVVQRDLREQRRRRLERRRRLARRALRRAGRARGEDHRAARLARRHRRRTGRRGAIRCSSESSIRSRRRRRRPPAQATKRLRPSAASATQVGELLVVDDRARLLALDHLGDLRAGERGVEVQAVGAELGQRHGGLDEAAVVAAHDGDAVALVDAVVGQRVRERVRAPVDLRERERAELVDHGGVVGAGESTRRGSRARGSAPRPGTGGRCARGGRAASAGRGRRRSASRRSGRGSRFR